MNDNLNLQEYIKSGDYFKDALEWYYHRYIQLISHILLLLIMAILVALSFITLALNTKNLFPYLIEIDYALKINSPETKKISIVRSSNVTSQANLELAEIFLRRYVHMRESYNYATLHKQSNYLRNTSTRVVFKNFSNNVSITSPNSLVAKYTDAVTREVKIISCNYLSDNKASIRFQASTKTTENKVISEDMMEAIITFSLDQFTKLPDGAPFNFLVSEYEVQQI
jgi:type IV secretory pathway component VirB8